MPQTTMRRRNLYLLLGLLIPTLSNSKTHSLPNELFHEEFEIQRTRANQPSAIDRRDAVRLNAKQPPIPSPDPFQESLRVAHSYPDNHSNPSLPSRRRSTTSKAKAVRRFKNPHLRNPEIWKDKGDHLYLKSGGSNHRDFSGRIHPKDRTYEPERIKKRRKKKSAKNDYKNKKRIRSKYVHIKRSGEIEPPLPEEIVNRFTNNHSRDILFFTKTNNQNNATSAKKTQEQEKRKQNIKEFEKVLRSENKAKLEGTNQTNMEKAREETSLEQNKKRRKKILRVRNRQKNNGTNSDGLQLNASFDSLKKEVKKLQASPIFYENKAVDTSVSTRSHTQTKFNTQNNRNIPKNISNITSQHMQKEKHYSRTTTPAVDYSLGDEIESISEYDFMKSPTASKTEKESKRKLQNQSGKRNKDKISGEPKTTTRKTSQHVWKESYSTTPFHEDDITLKSEYPEAKLEDYPPNPKLPPNLPLNETSNNEPVQKEYSSPLIDYSDEVLTSEYEQNKDMLNSDNKKYTTTSTVPTKYPSPFGQEQDDHTISSFHKVGKESLYLNENDNFKPKNNPKPEWIPMYKAGNFSNDDEYYLTSYNYKGDEKDQPRDVIKLSREAIKKGLPKKSQNIPDKKVASAKGQKVKANKETKKTLPDKIPSIENLDFSKRLKVLKSSDDDIEYDKETGKVNNYREEHSSRNLNRASPVSFKKKIKKQPVDAVWKPAKSEEKSKNEQIQNSRSKSRSHILNENGYFDANNLKSPYPNIEDHVLDKFSKTLHNNNERSVQKDPLIKSSFETRSKTQPSIALPNEDGKYVTAKSEGKSKNEQIQSSRSKSRSHILNENRYLGTNDYKSPYPNIEDSHFDKFPKTLLDNSERSIKKDPLVKSSFETRPKAQPVTLPNENGKYFMTMFKRVGDVSMEHIDSNGNQKTKSDGYLSSIKLSWNDDDTRAHVETSVDSRRQPYIFNLHNNNNYFNKEQNALVSEITAENERSLQLSRNEAIARVASRNNPTKSSSTEVNPKQHAVTTRHKRSTNDENKHFFSSHFTLGKREPSQFSLSYPETETFNKLNRSKEIMNVSESRSTIAPNQFRSSRLKDTKLPSESKIPKQQSNPEIRSYYRKPIDLKGIEQLTKDFNTKELHFQFDSHDKPARETKTVETFKSYQTPKEIAKYKPKLTFNARERENTQLLPRTTNIQTIKHSITNSSKPSFFHSFRSVPSETRLSQSSIKLKPKFIVETEKHRTEITPLDGTENVPIYDQRNQTNTHSFKPKQRNIQESQKNSKHHHKIGLPSITNYQRYPLSNKKVEPQEENVEKNFKNFRKVRTSTDATKSNHDLEKLAETQFYHYEDYDTPINYQNTNRTHNELKNPKTLYSYEKNVWGNDFTTPKPRKNHPNYHSIPETKDYDTPINYQNTNRTHNKLKSPNTLYSYEKNVWGNDYTTPEPRNNHPNYHTIPETHFQCKGAGYYADPEAGCQVFHMCQDSGKKHSFLCPNNTLFNQQLLVCDWQNKVNCESSETYYNINERIYSKESIDNDDDHETTKWNTWSYPKEFPKKNDITSRNTNRVNEPEKKFAYNAFSKRKENKLEHEDKARSLIKPDLSGRRNTPPTAKPSFESSTKASQTVEVSSPNSNDKSTFKFFKATLKPTYRAKIEPTTVTKKQNRTWNYSTPREYDYLKEQGYSIIHDTTQPRNKGRSTTPRNSKHPENNDKKNWESSKLKHSVQKQTSTPDYSSEFKEVLSIIPPESFARTLPLRPYTSYPNKKTSHGSRSNLNATRHQDVSTVNSDLWPLERNNNVITTSRTAKVKVNTTKGPKLPLIQKQDEKKNSSSHVLNKDSAYAVQKNSTQFDDIALQDKKIQKTKKKRKIFKFYNSPHTGVSRKHNKNESLDNLKYKSSLANRDKKTNYEQPKDSAYIFPLEGLPQKADPSEDTIYGHRLENNKKVKTENEKNFKVDQEKPKRDTGYRNKFKSIKSVTPPSLNITSRIMDIMSGITNIGSDVSKILDGKDHLYKNVQVHKLVSTKTPKINLSLKYPITDKHINITNNLKRGNKEESREVKVEKASPTMGFHPPYFKAEMFPKKQSKNLILDNIQAKISHTSYSTASDANKKTQIPNVTSKFKSETVSESNTVTKNGSVEDFQRQLPKISRETANKEKNKTYTKPVKNRTNVKPVEMEKQIKSFQYFNLNPTEVQPELKSHRLQEPFDIEMALESRENLREVRYIPTSLTTTDTLNPSVDTIESRQKHLKEPNINMKRFSSNKIQPPSDIDHVIIPKHIFQAALSGKDVPQKILISKETPNNTPTLSNLSSLNLNVLQSMHPKVNMTVDNSRRNKNDKIERFLPGSRNTHSYINIPRRIIKSKSNSARSQAHSVTEAIAIPNAQPLLPPKEKLPTFIFTINPYTQKPLLNKHRNMEEKPYLLVNQPTPRPALNLYHSSNHNSDFNKVPGEHKTNVNGDNLDEDCEDKSEQHYGDANSQESAGNSEIYQGGRKIVKNTAEDDVRGGKRHRCRKASKTNLPQRQIPSENISKEAPRVQNFPNRAALVDSFVEVPKIPSYQNLAEFEKNSPHARSISKISDVLRERGQLPPEPIKLFEGHEFLRPVIGTELVSKNARVPVYYRNRELESSEESTDSEKSSEESRNIKYADLEKAAELKAEQLIKRKKTSA